jgi:hypothetical protein
VGQYKVPQDVEAEDKIIAGYTLKQFIYAIIGVAYGFLTFRILSGAILIWLIVGAPPTLMFLLLGLYQRQGQPFETYFVSLVNYWFKPRRRIWIKEEVLEVFNLVQPKLKVVQKGLDPREVRGQLDRLAEIVDTRGWSDKQPELQDPDTRQALIDPTDRLQTAEVINSRPEPSEVGLAEDMLDLKHNPAARNLGSLIDDAGQHMLDEAKQRAGIQPPPVASSGEPQPALGGQPRAAAAPEASTSTMTTNPLAGILKAAMENQDLKVSQIAAQAGRAGDGTLAEGQSVNFRQP